MDAASIAHPFERLQRGERVEVYALPSYIALDQSLLACAKTKFHVATAIERNGQRSVFLKEHPDYPGCLSWDVEAFYDARVMRWFLMIAQRNNSND